MRDDEHTPPSPADAVGGFTPADQTRVPIPSRWRYFAPVVLLILVVLTFMPALDAGIVDWDDDDLLIHNTRHRTVDAVNLRWMFTTSYAGHFQPLTWLSYALDWAIWNREWFGFHLTNVLLHALCTIAFYFLTRRLLSVGRGSEWARSMPAVVSSMFAAAVFAVHPLRVESVAWLAERRDVLAGFFYIVSVGCYLRYVAATDRTTSARGARGIPYAGAVVLCGISLLAKASAITLPVVLLILDVYPLRRLRLGHDSASNGRPPSGLIWLEKVPFFALAVAAGVRALIAQAQGGALHGYSQHDLLARFAQACYGILFYPWKTILPTNLGPLYEIPPRDVLLGPMFWASVTGVVVVAIAATYLRRRCPALVAALVVYLVVVSPVLGLAQSGPQLVADRYSYLSCLGFAALAGAVLMKILGSDTWLLNPDRRALMVLISLLPVVALAVPTYRQSNIWLESWTLWSHGIRVSPNSAIAHTNYADALARQEFIEGAAEHYELALELNPNDPVAHHHFADMHVRFNRLDGAIYHYLHSLRIDPDRSRACRSLAKALVATGRAPQAVEVLRDGVGRHPDALELVGYFAQILSTHPDESVRNAGEAVKWAEHLDAALNHDDGQALLILASAYAEAGRFDEAISTAQKGIDVAEKEGAGPIPDELRRRLELFRQGKAYRSEG